MPACGGTGNGGYTFGLHIIEEELLSNRLDAEDFEQRLAVLVYQLECGVHHHVHAEQHQAERYHVRFLTAEQRIEFPGHFQLVLQDADGGQARPSSRLPP